jgi:hypothetical protein
MEVELDKLLEEKDSSSSNYESGLFDIPDFLR